MHTQTGAVFEVGDAEIYNYRRSVGGQSSIWSPTLLPILPAFLSASTECCELAMATHATSCEQISGIDAPKLARLRFSV